MLSKVYKILGKIDDEAGAGVVGYNEAASGDAIGVEGKTDSEEGYGLYTGDDTYVGGQTTTGSLETATVRTESKPRYDVTAWGATGNGETNDTAAIQEALDAASGAGGGVVYLPPGEYVVDPLTIDGDIEIVGDGERVSTLQSSVSGAGVEYGSIIQSDDAEHIKIRKLGFRGPGINAASGRCIDLQRTNNDDLSHVVLEDIWAKGFGETGIRIDTPITSRLTNVRISHCGRHGIEIDGGTSVTLQNCYSLTNVAAAFRLTATYSKLECCAAESSGYGYYLDVARNAKLESCGAELMLDRTSTYDERHYVIRAGGYLSVDNCYAKGFVDGNESSCYLAITDATNVTVECFRGVYETNEPGNGYTLSGNSGVTFNRCTFQASTNSGTPDRTI